LKLLLDLVIAFGANSYFAGPARRYGEDGEATGTICEDAFAGAEIQPPCIRLPPKSRTDEGTFDRGAVGVYDDPRDVNGGLQDESKRFRLLLKSH